MPGVVAAAEPPGARDLDRDVLLDLDPALLPAERLAEQFASTQADTGLWLVAAVRLDSLARDLLLDAAAAPVPATATASTETAFARLAASDPYTRARVLLAAALLAVGSAAERRAVAWDPRLQEIADLGAGLAAIWQQRGVTLPALPAAAAPEIGRARHTAPSAEQLAAINDVRPLAVEDPVVTLREQAAWLRAFAAAVAVQQHAAAQLARLGDVPMAARYRATLELAAAVQAAIAAIRR